MNLAQPVFQNFAEANQDRRMDAAQNELIDQLFQIDAARVVFGRMNPEMPVRSDGKVAFSPRVHIVELGCVADGPPFGGFENLGSVQNLHCQFVIPSWNNPVRAENFSVLRIAPRGKYNRVTNTYNGRCAVEQLRYNHFAFAAISSEIPQRRRRAGLIVH